MKFNNKNHIHFVLGDGVYPFVIGGMEVFNYYLIQKLRNIYEISYSATHRLHIDNLHYKRFLSIKPIKFFFPILLFIHLLFSKKINKVVFSYSAAHWIIWYSCYISCRLLNIPYIAIIHYGKQPPSEKEKLYRKFFSRAKTVVAVSEDIKRNFDAKYGINSEVIYPLVPFVESSNTKEQLREKYNIPQDAFVSCMVGSIKQMKNPDTLLSAICRLSDDEKAKYKPHIVYAGSGDMVDNLKRMVSEYQLENYVTFLGFVPKEDVGEVMKMSDIYVIASDFEGTSVSLLEAMFNKKPIIATDVPGIKDTISPEECLFIPLKDEIAMRQSIISLYEDSNLRKRLSENALRHYQKDYNYDRIIEQYTTILN